MGVVCRLPERLPALMGGHRIAPIGYHEQHSQSQLSTSLHPREEFDWSCFIVWVRIDVASQRERVVACNSARQKNAARGVA